MSKITAQAVRERIVALESAGHLSIKEQFYLDSLLELERVTAERDALREGEMGDAKHSDTMAAADIYFQLVEECEIPHGGSLVEHIDTMRDRIAELEAISSAAEKLVRCKGRYHSEQNYRALAALFGVTTPDMPPLESEARTVTVKLPHQFKTSMYGTPLYEQCDILAMLADAGINLTVEG